MKRGIFISSAGVFGSAFLWLLSFKVVAHLMGPEGVGLFSQLRQMAQAATVTATLGGTNSVVQGIAERSEEGTRQQLRATASRFIGMAGVGMAFIMILAAPQLTQFFLSSNASNLVATIRWIALAVLLNVGATYSLAVLNGYRSYHYLALAQIAGPTALVMLLAGAWRWRISPEPQLLATSFVLCYAATYLVAAVGVSRLPGRDSGSSGTLTKEHSRAFVRFALSNLIAALSTTVALLLIRSWVIEAKGLGFAGLFDAGWTLTFNYTTLFLTACSTIYLPLLTAATQPERQKACVQKTAYIVISASMLVCYAMVLLKTPLIDLLYSPQFEASGQVLLVLVIAVIFRSVSWVYGAMILATRNSRVLLTSDLALNLLLLATTRYALVHFSSLSALSWAFVLPNFLYLLFVVEYARWKNPLMHRRHIWPLIVAGTSPLFYLALAPPGLEPAYLGPALWLCMAIGLAVSGAAFLAYRKVAL